MRDANLQGLIDRINAQQEQINFLSRLELVGKSSTNFSETGVVFVDSSVLTTDSSNFVWDNTEKVLIVGGNTQGFGGSKVWLRGADSSIDGPHLSFATNADNYPTLQILNSAHNNINLSFDAYFDGTNWRSGSVSANYQIQKAGTLFQINYKSGVAAGNVVSWSTGIVLNSSGNVGINKSPSLANLDVNGNIAAANNTLIGTHATYGSGFSAFWRNGTDYALLTDGTHTYLNAPNADGQVYIRHAGSEESRFDGSGNFYNYGAIYPANQSSFYLNYDASGIFTNTAFMSRAGLSGNAIASRETTVNATLAMFSGEPGTSFNNGILGYNYYPLSGSSTGRLNTSVGGSYIRMMENSIRLFTINSGGGVSELFRANGGNISFFGGTDVGKQTVTGSRGGNAALASLLTALANYGLITNSTTA